jgi:hypothetical protein
VKQNSEDAIRHGTFVPPPQVDVRGEWNGQSKLTTGQVLSILHDGRLQREIAASYGVGQMTISRINIRSRPRRVWE